MRLAPRARFLIVWACLMVFDIPVLAAQPKPSAQGVLTTLPALPLGSLVALLPPARAPEEAADDHASPEALRTVADTLRAKGFRVLAPEQVTAALVGHAADACRNPATCDPQLALRALEADAVVSLAVWQRPDAPSQVAVHVRRTRGYGQAEVAVDERGVAVATAAALQQALDDSRQTHERVVRVETQPIGATLRVDQNVVARTPARLLLLPGNHLISVEAPGYVTRAQYLDVPDKASTPLRIDIALAPARAILPVPRTDAVRAPAADRGTPTSAWNDVVAVGLLAMAVPLIANVIHSATTHGECVGEIDARDRCAERVVFGPAFYASAGLASVALLGSATFLLLQPIGAETGPAPRGALLGMRRTF